MIRQNQNVKTCGLIRKFTNVAYES